MSNQTNVATVRVGNVWTLPSVIEKLGLDARSLLGEVHLSRTDFEDPEGRIPYSAVDRLFARIVEKSGCQHVGLLSGMMLSDLGLPGFLLMNAPTVRAGLRDLVSSLQHNDGGGVATLNEQQGVAMLSYTVATSGITSVDQICDHSVAAGYGLLKRLIGSDFEVAEIRLPQRAPLDQAPYRACFGSTIIRFNSYDAVIEFPASFLDAPISGASPTLYKFLKTVQAKAGEGVSMTMADQIRRILPNLIRLEPVDNRLVAHLLGLSPRAMARRLADEKTTLHELIDEARFEVAQQLLRDTDIGITEVAAALYYSDASAFSRAFRRKLSVSPAAWRKAQHKS